MYSKIRKVNMLDEAKRLMGEETVALTFRENLDNSPLKTSRNERSTLHMFDLAEDLDLVVEEGDRSVKQVELGETYNSFEPFRSFFFKKAQLNFMCAETLTIVCFLFHPKEGVHKMLEITPEGEKVLDVAESDLHKFKGSLSSSMLKFLNKKYHSKKSKVVPKFYKVESDLLQENLLTLEASFTSHLTTFRVGLIYGRAGQSEEDMLTSYAKEKVDSIAFQKFLTLLYGEHKEEEGTFDHSEEEQKHTKSIHYKGFEIIVHNATMMNQEEHRRLIGNDLALIYFIEGGAMKVKRFRGQVNSLACVVKKEMEDMYSMGGFFRSNISPYPPKIPENHYFDSIQLKEALLMKVINGLIACQKCPPISLMYARLFNNKMKDAIAKFPHKSK